MALSLRESQKRMVNFIQRQGSGLVNGEMGTGKTRAALAMMDAPAIKLVLVVCPAKAIFDAWVPHFVEHEKDMTNQYCVVPLTGKVKDRAKLVRQQRDPEKTYVFIVNYEVIHRKELFPALLTQPWDQIILDESHRMTAHNSLVSKRLYRLGKLPSVKNKVCLTGTPMPNGPTSIWGQIRFLDDTFFNYQNEYGELVKAGTSWYAFRMRYEETYPLGRNQHIRITEGYKNLDELSHKLSEIMLVIRFDDLTNEDITRPLTTFTTIRVPLTKATCKAYYEIEDDLITEIEKEVLTVDNILVKMLRLHQLCGGFLKPDYSDETKLLDRSKVDYLLDRITDLQPGEPFVIFAQYRAEIDLIRKSLTLEGITNSEVSGQHNDLLQWQQGKTRALVVQMSAGSEAINLTRARYAFYYSMNFSHAKYEQSIARLSRPGSNHATVHYYFLVADTVTNSNATETLLSMDEIVLTALRTKGNIQSNVINMLRSRQ